ncbi:MAG: hypothetical protein A2V85_00095 [Chloroflexi bacterium RBG_16_72_14]|nr:MAG: hypothetical protein A2V85_00095 [Chloroflexi bacterium RBG_16_72_14]
MKRPPPRRPLKILSLDPSAGLANNRVAIDVPNEELSPGPCGARIRVVDWDAANRRFYAPVDLDEDPILMGGGLDPSESDPRFHQQMTYAVAMRVLENFEQALGRQLHFLDARHRRRVLTIVPHAFQGPNAFFDPNSEAILFGYFRADEVDPGPNLPGQTVFTCLSHDVIAHETSHAIVHRLRPYFNEATNTDVLAFHEGFADIVAIFQHFTFPKVLEDQIRKCRGDLQQPGPLFELARQFGYATGQGAALRSAREGHAPDPTEYRTVLEPHDRGSILVAAVFDAFFAAYQARSSKLIRLATGGTGRLPEGELRSDLVPLLAQTASRAAESVLRMCIRAMEYVPPVDITFGDYLRALVTADYDLFPEDAIGQRAALIEAFRARGIYPSRVTSLAEESVMLSGDSTASQLTVPREIITTITTNGLFGGSAMSYKHVADALRDYGTAEEQVASLQLEPDLPVKVQGFHPLFRVGSGGRVRVDIVAQFVQTRPQTAHERRQLGGLALRGGTTVVISEDGSIRYITAKPVPGEAPDAVRPLDRLRAFVDETDARDPSCAWLSEDAFRRRMVARSSFRAVHRGIPQRHKSSSKSGVTKP